MLDEDLKQDINLWTTLPHAWWKAAVVLLVGAALAQPVTSSSEQLYTPLSTWTFNDATLSK